MYKKTNYKYHARASEYTGKSKVLPDFLEDLNIARPVSVTEYKTRLYVFFGGEKYQILYTLPPACKKYLINVEAIP